jgi:hypothetical protein
MDTILAMQDLTDKELWEQEMEAEAELERCIREAAEEN